MLLVPALLFAGDGIHRPSMPSSRKRGVNFARYVYQSCGYFSFQASHQKAWSTTLPFQGFDQSGWGVRTAKPTITRAMMTTTLLQRAFFMRILLIDPPAAGERRSAL